MAPNLMNYIRFGDIHGPKPYEFIRFGDIHGPKPYLMNLEDYFGMFFVGASCSGGVVRDGFVYFLGRGRSWKEGKCCLRVGFGIQ